MLVTNIKTVKCIEAGGNDTAQASYSTQGVLKLGNGI